jgi:hypothetical protein
MGSGLVFDPRAVRMPSLLEMIDVVGNDLISI